MFLRTLPEDASRGRVLLKAGPQPSGQRPMMARRHGGPEAHTVLLLSGESTRMHRFASGLGAQTKDGEFELVYHVNNHFNPFRSFLSLHVDK